MRTDSNHVALRFAHSILLVLLVGFFAQSSHSQEKQVDKQKKELPCGTTADLGSREIEYSAIADDVETADGEKLCEACKSKLLDKTTKDYRTDFPNIECSPRICKSGEVNTPCSLEVKFGEISFSPTIKPSCDTPFVFTGTKKIKRVFCYLRGVAADVKASCSGGVPCSTPTPAASDNSNMRLSNIEPTPTPTQAQGPKVPTPTGLDTAPSGVISAPGGTNTAPSIVGSPLQPSILSVR